MRWVVALVVGVVALSQVPDLKEEKRVPSLIGLSPEAAKQKLEDAGLGVDESGGDLLFTGDDTVCSQEPRAGSMTKDDVRISIEGDACGAEKESNGGSYIGSPAHLAEKFCEGQFPGFAQTDLREQCVDEELGR